MKIKMEIDFNDFCNEMETFDEFLKGEISYVVRQKIKEKMKRSPTFREFIKAKSTEALEKFL